MTPHELRERLMAKGWDTVDVDELLPELDAVLASSPATEHVLEVRSVLNGSRSAIEIVCSCGDYCDWNGTRQRLTLDEVNGIMLLHVTGYVRALERAAQFEYAVSMDAAHDVVMGKVAEHIDRRMDELTIGDPDAG